MTGKIYVVRYDEEEIEGVKSFDTAVRLFLGVNGSCRVYKISPTSATKLQPDAHMHLKVYEVNEKKMWKHAYKEGLDPLDKEDLPEHVMAKELGN